jgi:hypothetical protein
VAEQVVTVRDIAALTERQRDVLGFIAINEDAGHHPATLRALVRKGLIEEREQRLPGPGLPVYVKRYMTPTAAHVAWCAWCSEQEEAGDD